MALDADIRAVVALAKTVFASLLVDVVHEVKTGQDGDGKASFGAPTTYQAFVFRKGDTAPTKLTRLTGGEIVEGASVLFIENVVIGPEDRLTFANGTIAPIASVESVDDPTGGVYYAMALCGRPDRGTLQS